LHFFRQTRHSENVCRGVRLHVRTLKYLLFLYKSTFTIHNYAGNVTRVRIPTTLVAHSPSSKIVLLLNYFSFEAGGEPKATERPRVRPQSRRDAVKRHFSEGITPDVCRVKLGSRTPFGIRFELLSLRDNPNQPFYHGFNNLSTRPKTKPEASENKQEKALRKH